MQSHNSIEDGLQKGQCEIYPVYMLIIKVVDFKTIKRVFKTRQTNKLVSKKKKKKVTKNLFYVMAKT